jgi:hypothetical protein
LPDLSPGAGSFAGTVRRWKRDTSPPVEKVVFESSGRLAKATSICFSCVGLAFGRDFDVAGRDRALKLRRIVGDRAQRQRQRADALRNRDLLGDARRNFDRDVGEGLDLVLPSSFLSVTRWSVASTRTLRMIVSDTLSAGPSPPPSTCLRQHQVDMVAREDEAGDAGRRTFTGTVMARMPAPSAAARKPRSCGPTSEPRVTG